MDIIILGAGKFGCSITENLAKEGHNVVVIDQKLEKVDFAIENYDVMGISGDALAVSTLLEAGTERADIFIATTEADEKNMLSALLAKKLGAKHVIARVRNPLYNKQTAFMREKMGINMMINPELEAAREIARMLKFPEAAHIETFAKGKIELAGVRVDEKSGLCDHSLREIGKKFSSSALVCAVERSGEVIIPNGDFVIKSGDRISLTAEHTKLTAFLKEAGIIQGKIRSVMIIGMGSVGFYLASILQELGMRVKIIDYDRKNCEEKSSLLPKADVVFADGTNHQVLLEEGISDYDALVSLTGVDEENMIVSLFASSSGVEKVVTKISSSMLAPLVEKLGLDSIITPKDIAADIVTTYVRAKENAKDSGVLTLYKLAGGIIEALEFQVGEQGRYIGKKLKDLKIKKDVLIGAIVRGNKIEIAGGESTIEVGDRVLAVAKNAHFTDLSQLFE